MNDKSITVIATDINANLRAMAETTSKLVSVMQQMAEIINDDPCRVKGDWKYEACDCIKCVLQDKEHEEAYGKWLTRVAKGVNND